MANVSFRVSGEFITEMSRNIFAEGRWRRAFNFLIESVEGLSVEQAIDVLTGKKKFIGINEIDLVDDEDEHLEYDEIVQYHYGAIYELKNNFYQPYAYVDSYCEDDLVGPGHDGLNKHHPHCTHRMSTSRKVDSIWRALYYSDDGTNDCALSLNLNEYHNEAATRDVVVLFKMVQMPPFWMTTTTYPQESLDAFLISGHMLQRRGGFCRIAAREGFYDKLRNENLEPVNSSEIPIGLSPSFVQDMANATGIDPETIESLTSEHDFDSQPLTDSDLISNYGYVLLDGSFYGCRFFEHKALATRILKHVVGIPADKKEDAEKDPDKYGENLGWVKITKGQFDKKNKIVLPRMPTVAQKETLQRWLVGREDIEILE